MSDIQRLAEQLGLHTRSYSGRSMYGRSCLGIVADFDEIVSLFYELGKKQWDYPAGSIKSDNLGFDTIYYFPQESFDDEDND